VADVTPLADNTTESVTTVAAVPASGDNYPNFRGEGGRGIVSKKDIPVSWDGASGTNILWKTEIPLAGNNSPVVWGEKVFIAGSDGKKQAVYGIDRNSGKILWTANVGSGTKSPVASAETGFSASTAVTDGIGVYVIFSTGDIAAIDMNGKKIWERDLGLPENHYGHASSLMLYNGNILIQFDQRTSPKIMALSTKTGSTVWSTDRPVKLSWTSPILVNTGSRDELMTVSEPYVISYNPANGKELWRIECISGEVGASLAYANGIVFSVNEYSNLCAIKLGAQPSILWQNNELLSDIPSPVATDKYFFMATSYGVMVCYDAVTGEKYWEHDFGKSIYGSPMIVGDNVYVLDMTGIMHIFSADKEFKLVGESKLGEFSVCTAAFTNGRIYIRGEKNLYCIGK
jgi:outer membrane protein assembly factor BamB